VFHKKNIALTFSVYKMEKDNELLVESIECNFLESSWNNFKKEGSNKF